jgi:hypothetical protein
VILAGCDPTALGSGQDRLLCCKPHVENSYEGKVPEVSACRFCVQSSPSRDTTFPAPRRGDKRSGGSPPDSGATLDSLDGSFGRMY